MVFNLSAAMADALHGIDQKAWRLDIAGKSYLLRGAALLVSFILGEAVFQSLLAALVLMAVSAHCILYFYDYRVCQKQVGITRSNDRRKALTLIKIGLPLALYTVLINAIAVVPRLQIEHFYDEEILGFYSSVTIPTALIPQLASFVFSPLMGMFARFRVAKDTAGMRRLLLYSVGAVAAIGVLAVGAGKLLGKQVLVFVFGPEIEAYAYLLLPMICAAILTALVWLFGGLLTVYKDFYALAGMTFLSLIVCIFLCPRLIESQGLTGAVYALGVGLLTEVILLTARFFWHAFFRTKTFKN